MSWELPTRMRQFLRHLSLTRAAAEETEVEIVVGIAVAAAMAVETARKV